jgi:hypothetical protein
VIVIFLAQDQQTVGELRYDERSLSFDFFADDPTMIDAETFGLQFGSLQLETSRRDGKVLYVWGYQPLQPARASHLEPPNVEVSGLRVVDLTFPPTGVAASIRPVSEIVAHRDLGTGWLRLSVVPPPAGSAPTRMVEFATDCMAELIDGQLTGLWLRPAR